jgi:uncharacterized protein with PIN domain
MDHMVIRLGKYLRIIGCDAAWDLHVRTQDLIVRANLEDRVFVTRNRRLPHQYPAPIRLFTLDDTDPVAQFDRLIAAWGLDPGAKLFSQCIRCNVALDPVPDKAAIRERVHPNVLNRYDRFFRCPRCGTVFWHGSHVRNTCRKLRLAPPTPSAATD